MANSLENMNLEELINLKNQATILNNRIKRELKRRNIEEDFIGSKSLNDYYAEMEEFEVQFDVYDEKLIKHLKNWFEKNHHVIECKMITNSYTENGDRGCCISSWIDEKGRLQMEAFDWIKED